MKSGNILLRLLLLIVFVSPVSARSQQVFQDCPDCPPMVWLPDQTLAVAQTETSRQQWLACVAAAACQEKPVRWPEPNMPMTHVVVADAEAYARWLSSLTGRTYRLPTESEWQTAAMAGTQTRFPWGETMQPKRAVCQKCDPDFDHRPAPIASMSANPWGLYDMNGNVWEWTADCWKILPDGRCPQRVVKGGSWYFIAAQSASTSRAPQDEREWSYDVGFRVVRER